MYLDAWYSRGQLYRGYYILVCILSTYIKILVGIYVYVAIERLLVILAQKSIYNYCIGRKQTRRTEGARVVGLAHGPQRSSVPSAHLRDVCVVVRGCVVIRSPRKTMRDRALSHTRRRENRDPDRTTVGRILVSRVLKVSARRVHDVTNQFINNTQV